MVKQDYNPFNLFTGNKNTTGNDDVVNDDVVYSDEVIEHFLWRYMYLPKEPNNTPKYMYDIASHLLNPSIGSTKNIKAFRGSGKSINTCIMALDRVVNGHVRFVMIVSDTMTQSEALLDDIKSLIEDGMLNVEVTRSVAGKLEFVVDGLKCAIYGVGAGMSLRGRKFNRMRSDLVITDDLVNDASSMNKVRRDRLSRWMYKVLKPSMNPDSEMWNVGTPLNDDDIFMRTCKMLPEATIDIPLVQGVWPDRFSDEWIDRTKKEYIRDGMLSAWKQEYELVLVDDETAIFEVNKINTCVDSETPKLTFFCTLDGAFSEKTGADFSAFTVLGIDEHGSWFVWTYAMKSNPQKVISKLFELQAKFGFNAVGIEKGQFLLSMKVEVERMQIDTQQFFNVEELNTAGSKLARIKALAPIVNSGRLTLVDTGEDTERLYEQFELTDNEKCAAGTDDQIDSCCQLLQMNLYYSEPVEYTREDYLNDFDDDDDDLFSDRNGSDDEDY